MHQNTWSYPLSRLAKARHFKTGSQNWRKLFDFAEKKCMIITAPAGTGLTYESSTKTRNWRSHIVRFLYFCQFLLFLCQLLMYFIAKFWFILVFMFFLYQFLLFLAPYFSIANFCYFLLSIIPLFVNFCGQFFYFFGVSFCYFSSEFRYRCIVFSISILPVLLVNFGLRYKYNFVTIWNMKLRILESSQSKAKTWTTESSPEAIIREVGGWYSYIHLVPNWFPLKTSAFTVCEHK